LAKQTKNKFRQKLVHKYRLVILNEDTLEERVSFKLNRLNVYVIGGLFSIFLILFTILLIAFTPLREYIPGYSSTALNKKAVYLVYKADSLEQAFNKRYVYMENLKNVLSGKIKEEDIKLETNIKKIKIDDSKLKASKRDSLFRLDVEQKDRFSIIEKASKEIGMVFFAPIKGKITDNYDAKEKHFAVDIAVKKGTPVTTVADGTVIFSDFTAETGYVIIVEHKQEFLSIYKHNASVFKSQGDMVKSGEVIASAGSTGTLTTGPHLHFELWRDGYPVNPTKYIDFE
jgi:murein DD-endopeptidase MepM/ murein hydrolase activator NlpD